jgi:hypothetical protein
MLAELGLVAVMVLGPAFVAIWFDWRADVRAERAVREAQARRAGAVTR